jgi:hypothetical protein
MFEVAGTYFHQGVFELCLEKRPPVLLRWLFALGPIRARLVGLAFLLFAFLFSTSRGPMTFILEQGYAATPELALALQYRISYSLFFIAVFFYVVVFFFKKEQMFLTFNKASKIYSVEHEPFFRFKTGVKAHVPFQEIIGVEKLPPDKALGAPHGRILIKSRKMPRELEKLEFAVLTDEQYEYFPQNIENLIG